MQIVAKVIEFEISRRDLERECAKLNLPDNQQSLMQALERLIDRCLLLSQANQLGIEISDEEYDAALLELIEEDEPFGLKARICRFCRSRTGNLAPSPVDHKKILAGTVS
jgi:hypothetical protein